LSLSLILALAGCSEAERENGKLDERAVEIWKEHENVWAEVVEGESWDAQELLRAVEFFERITGLKLEINLSSYVGPIPLAGSEDLRRIRAWYRRNKERLYFDPDSEIVKVRERQGYRKLTNPHSRGSPSTWSPVETT
jgi:hypothetical protein